MLTLFRRRFPQFALFGGLLGFILSFGLASAQTNEPGSEPPPSTMRRLTEAQYRGAIADIFGPDIKIVGRFEPDLRVDGLLAAGSSAVSITPAGLEQYEDIARQIASQVVDEAHRDKLIGCAPNAQDREGRACARTFFKRVGLRLYRRPLTAGQVDGLAARAVAAERQLGNFHAGVGAALAGMLTSPNFLFRIDSPLAGRPDQVDAYSKATRLSFLLWNSTPDEALLAAAASGALDRPEALASEVDRLMASPRFGDGVRAFFTDYLQLDDIDVLSKDTLLFPAFTSSVANATREQTLRTINDLLVERNGDFRDLFTSRRIAMTRELGPLYDIPVARQGWYIHEFPEGDPRVGLISHASMLALHSHPGRTSPTLRGKALSEVLLCEKVPSPPANVNFAVVQDVNNPTLKTTRARLQAHLDDEECASCHKRMDPLGLGLEQFDGAGKFRTSEHGERIDVTGTFNSKPFNGVAQLGQLFHDDPQVSACLVKSFWRFANGRELRADDAGAVDGLRGAFASNGHRMTALIRAVALNPAYYAMPRLAGPVRRTAGAAMKNKGEGS